MLTGMTQNKTLTRSPELMSPEDRVLLVVDVQEKLMPLIGGAPRILWNLRRLLDGAAAVGLRATATEQYPQGLGPTVAELASRLGTIPSKMSFSCGGWGALARWAGGLGGSKGLVAGDAAHVCGAQ